MSNLKGLEDELRAEMSKNDVVRIKRRLIQDQTQDLPVARTLEAKPVKKALFEPTNLPQNQTRFPSPVTAREVKSLTGPSPTVSMVGYTAVKHSSVPVVVRAFPACVNIGRNFFSPASQLSTYQQLLPDKRGAANMETVPKSNLDEDLVYRRGNLYIEAPFCEFFFF